MFRIFLSRQGTGYGECGLLELNGSVFYEIPSFCSVSEALPFWREKLLDEEDDEVDTLGVISSE